MVCRQEEKNNLLAIILGLFIIFTLLEVEACNSGKP